MTGRADVALGHATSGPALQQNLVCMLAASTVAASTVEASTVEGR